MRLHRPAVLAALALGTILPVTAASAATGVAAAGNALSSATLATINVGGLVVGQTVVDGHAITVGSLTAVAQTITSASPAVSFVPVTLDGVQSGAVTVTPANSPTTIGGVSTSAPLDVIAATSPAATLTATSAASGPTSALTASLGSISLFGLPIVLNGSLAVGSGTDASKAQAGKTLTIQNVSFPSLADLLEALGIDVEKLPVDTLNALVDDLLGATLSEATGAAFEAASDAVDDAYDAMTAAQGAAAAAEDALATATTTFDTALSGADLTGADFTGTGVTGPLDHADWDTLSDSVAGQAAQTVISAIPANAGVVAAAAAYEAAKDALVTAQNAVGPLVGALDDAIGALAGVVEDILAGTSLVSVGKATIGTKAAVSTSKTAEVTGSVTGVKVMGLDVLKEITGSSTIDAAELVGDTATAVNDAIGALTDSLSDILSSLTGATGLVVPAPTIQVMTKSTSTGTDGAFGTADVAVDVLSVSMESATVPRAFAVSPLVYSPAGKFRPLAIVEGKTQPFSVKIGTLAEAARFRPATGTTTPTTPGTGNELPSTGAPYGLAIVAIIGTGVAVGTRRHLRTVRA